MAKPRQLWTWIAALDPLVKDVTLAIGLELLTVAELAIPLPILSIGPGPPPAWPAISLAMVAPLAWRRRAPLEAFAVQAAAYVISVVASGHLGFSLSLLGALFIGAYSSGIYAEKRAWSLATVVAAGLGSGLALGIGRFLGGIPGLDAAILLVPWLIGNSVRAQRRLVASLQDRALRLEREREATARAAAAEERSRIARELHDVVAHGVSVMVVQAEAARRLMRRRPEDAEEALRMVSSTGSQALNELKHLLGVLSDGEHLELEPAPRLRDLDAMLARLHASGMQIELTIDGDVRPLSRGLELTAYRIIQEALTNVLKHADAGRARVRLHYDQKALAIEVTDSGHIVPRANGAGHGLLGMRQRVEAYGGELQAGPRHEGGYAVRALLPVEASP